MLRYGSALVVAAVVILAGFLFVRLTVGEIQARFEEQRQRWKQQKADGTLPKSLNDVDLDSMQWTDVGVAVTPGLGLRLDLALWMSDFWYVLVPLVIAASLSAAYLIGRLRR